MKLRPFELALVIIFGGLAGLALFMMATYKSSGDIKLAELSAIGQVTIWGTLPADGVNSLFKELSFENPLFKQITYKYHDPKNFNVELRDAISYNKGPNVILLPSENLVALRDRITPVSYVNFPDREIRDRYVDGAHIFALSDGLYGYPVAVDPIMMYWNKDILTTEGFLEPPKTWESLVNTMFPALIQRDFDRTIKRSVVAMGEYDNVRNSFGVLSALLLQGGTKGVIDTGKNYSMQLAVSELGSSDPLRAAANFYTNFSKSNNTLYSWNRSLPEDRQQFIAGDLAFYFGYASEAKDIERANPNLNFDIAEIPQGADATVRRTYGKMYAFSVLKVSDNVAGAGAVVAVLASSAIADKFATSNNLVPAYRATVAQGNNDVYSRAAYKSAGITFGWLNPERVAADNIFGTMVKDINENRSNVDNASIDVITKLSKEYK
ncbi:MAG: hypothetical protein RLZZ230_307 [Candidatus Parcubacteria bacterium]|jgi:ABC-type glycerol-3-phosphate transport system substrate-binding protein